MNKENEKPMQPKQVDWRKNVFESDNDPDDEDKPCPSDVKAVLGFDPDEETQ